MEISNRNSSCWLPIGACMAAVAVGLGAFGAHGLESAISGSVEDPTKNIELWETASRYQMYHSLGICVVGLCAAVFGRRFVFDLAATLFCVGIVLFSGLLYAMAITDAKILGAIVPLGGLSMISGWLSFAAGFVFKRTQNDSKGSNE